MTDLTRLTEAAYAEIRRQNPGTHDRSPAQDRTEINPYDPFDLRAVVRVVVSQLEIA